jgi:hypothetical protein
MQRMTLKDNGFMLFHTIPNVLYYKKQNYTFFSL